MSGNWILFSIELARTTFRIANREKINRVPRPVISAVDFCNNMNDFIKDPHKFYLSYRSYMLTPRTEEEYIRHVRQRLVD